jgi:hypothetical protein
MVPGLPARPLIVGSIGKSGLEPETSRRRRAGARLVVDDDGLLVDDDGLLVGDVCFKVDDDDDALLDGDVRCTVDVDGLLVV